MHRRCNEFGPDLMSMERLESSAALSLQSHCDAKMCWLAKTFSLLPTHRLTTLSKNPSEVWDTQRQALKADLASSNPSSSKAELFAPLEGVSVCVKCWLELVCSTRKGTIGENNGFVMTTYDRKKSKIACQETFLEEIYFKICLEVLQGVLVLFKDCLI